jgi:outer membrane immunogenic protein
MKARILALGSAASIALLATGAFAADLPVRAPAPAPLVYAPIFTWTGFYAGVNAGYANTRNRSSFSYAATEPGGAFPGNGTCLNWDNDAENNGAEANPCYPYPLFVPSPNNDTSLAANQDSLAAAIAAGVLPTRGVGGSDGVFTGGVQLGYNFQTGSLVIGVEADWNYLGANQRESWIGNEDGFFNRGITYSTRNDGSFRNFNRQDATAFATSSTGVDWLATMRLRLGFAVDNVLLYATGGLAVGSVKSSSAISVVSDVGSYNEGGEIDALWTGRTSETRAGWALGAGVEWAFAPNWSLKAEYLHYDLGDTSYALVGNGVVGGGGSEPRDGADYAIAVRAKSSNSGDIFRVGLNYRFGAPARAMAPVVARY